ncbi:MAG: portal protein, partial [Nitrospiria bacterium]
MPRKKQPGEDRPVAKGADLTVLTALREYKQEATDAKRERLTLNRFNTYTYLGKQDWSHKQKGQSKEFLPKVPVAVEQFSAFVKRGLIQFGEWFSMDMPPGSVLEPHQARKLFMSFLDRMPDGIQKWTNFATVFSDGVKKGLLESLIILKIHGRKRTERQFYVERGTEFISVGEDGVRAKDTKALKTRNIEPWRLIIDLIGAEDYFPDPTDRNLYEIHTVERDLSDLIEMAENDDIYDPDVLELIDQDFSRQHEEWDKQRRRNQNYAQTPSFRKRVVLDEFWGDILDTRGRVVKKNCVAAIANDRYLLRPPEDNPFWHQESPFVAFPLIRVPGSVWHKAIFDHVAPLNIALNELFNLMLDGGLSSVWGIKQVRTGLLEDPKQIAGGIPQGISLAIKDETPQDMKVVETVSEGKVPQEAIAMYQIADKEHLAASLGNELRIGTLPPKQVKATEVIEASQAANVTLDAISADMESGGLEPALRKGWMNICQFANDVSSREVVAAIGTRAALVL